MNTSTGRKINPLPPKKGRKYWYQEFFCLMWVWILFVEGNHFLNHHDPSQQKARIFKAPISWREHRERVISEAAVAFRGRSWCYKWHGGGVPSKQVIRTDSKQSSHLWLHTGILLHWSHLWPCEMFWKTFIWSFDVIWSELIHILLTFCLHLHW